MKRRWHVGSRVRRSAAVVVSSAALVAGMTIWGAPSALAATSPCTDGSMPAQLSTVTCAPGKITLTVPPGTTSVDLNVIGGGGGTGYSDDDIPGHPGGNAGVVTGTATLPAGTAYLYVIVGRAGNGNNGVGASASGGSAVLAVDSNHALLAKLAIAGGGGGGGESGDGGDAGSPGTSVDATAGPGSAGIGATGGAGGTGAFVGGRGGNDNPVALAVAIGGVFALGEAGNGGGGYGGGGGGGVTKTDEGLVGGGGGGGSSFASSYLASATVGIAAGTRGLPELIGYWWKAGDGAAGSVTLTFHGVPVPSAPTGVTGTAGEGQASVSFTAPVVAGGSAITGYTVTANPGGLTATCPDSPCVITGLTNGTPYTFTVHATNSDGDSAESLPSAAVMPVGPPLAPTDVAVTSGNAQATVSFPAPSDEGSPITGYDYSIDSGLSWLPLTTTGTAPVTGTITSLTNGTTYQVQVRAINSIDIGPASTPTAVTPATTPEVPSAVSVVGGTGQVTVSFTAPDTGGSPITGYEVSTDGGDTWLPLAMTGSGPELTGTVTDLDAETSYQVLVQAINAVGTGTPTEAVTVTTLPATVPTPMVVAGTASVTVSWTASPAGTVTGYTVYAQPGPATCVTTSISDTSCVIGATTGISYTYTVIAHSPSGDSASSPASAATTAGPPQVPAASPGTAPATLTTTDGVLTSITPGQQITVLGTGFLAYSSVAVILYSSPEVLGTAITDADGNFSTHVTVPSSLAAGAHQLVASGVDVTGTIMFIRMPVTYTDSTGTTTGPLANTGAPALQLTLWAGLAIAAGFLLLSSGRRRNTRQSTIA